MNRSEAQQQLAAVAQAVREHKAVTPGKYPVLRERTRRHILLWHFTGMQIPCENWDEACIADWYEYEAINHLILDNDRPTA